MAYLYSNLDKPMLSSMALIAGNAGHEMRNILAVAISPMFPELQTLDRLSGQIEGQCREIASLLTCGMDTKPVIVQAHRKSAFVSRILSDIPLYCTAETELSALHKDQMRELLAFQQTLLLQFDAHLNSAYTKLLTSDKQRGREGKVEVLSSVHGDAWSIDLEYDVPSLEAKHADEDLIDSVAQLDEITRTACNNAHQIQNLASIHNKKGPFQPNTQKLINLAGQIENSTRAIRGALSRARQNVPMHPKPRNMLDNIITQCTKQLTNVENNLCEIQETKTGIDDTDRSVELMSKSIWQFVVSAGGLLGNGLAPNFLLIPL